MPLLSAILVMAAMAWPPAPLPNGIDLPALYAEEVRDRLEIPDDEVNRYAALLHAALTGADLGTLPPQFFVLADRDPRVQAVMVWWKSPDGSYQLVGASPASTGRGGSYDHFLTPLGVFEHGQADFRAEGSRNALGVRGYGSAGLRVYDFGWQLGQRTWGRGGSSAMRLQMHSTDPELLEPRIGSAQSKGCIRIPASLNRFLDHYGILDAPYEPSVAAGAMPWVLAPDRDPLPWAGRYLVIVDSARSERPEWSPRPREGTSAGPPAAP